MKSATFFIKFGWRLGAGSWCEEGDSMSLDLVQSRHTSKWLFNKGSLKAAKRKQGAPEPFVEDKDNLSRSLAAAKSGCTRLTKAELKESEELLRALLSHVAIPPLESTDKVLVSAPRADV